MDNPKLNENDPWDQSIYGTGRTDPPKSKGGILAVLLILVIFLSGITCVLSILNIRLSRQLENQQPQQLLSFTMGDDVMAMEDPTIAKDQKTESGDVSIDLYAPPAETGFAQSDATDWSGVYEKNIPSVVSISCELPRGSSAGTGVVLSRDGYIVTNAHVVEDAIQVTVLLSDNRIFEAVIVGADEVSDLAVLHIDAEDLIPAKFGDSSSLQVGEAVVAIGDPLGIEFRGTMTDGIISAINRDMTLEGRTMTLIQTNAALNSGNSGGPLINRHGLVIGINTMKISAFVDKAGVEGLGFAIPSATVKDIVSQIIENGYVSGRPTLDLSCESLSMFYRYYYGLPEGMYVTEVTPGGAAAKLGITTGDIILELDGVQTTSMEALNSALYAHEAGDKVDIIIYRGGKKYASTITLGEDRG
jgi:serine protease Do